MANFAFSAVTSVPGTANQIDSSGGLNPIISLSNNPIVPGTGALTLPAGNTVQRLGGAGSIRYNTQTGLMEFTNDGATWNPVSPGMGLVDSVSGTANQITSTGGVNPIIGLASNAILPGTGGVTIPTGNTAQRAGILGTMRFNSQTAVFEGTTDGATWETFSTGAGVVLSVTGTALQIDCTPGPNVVVSIDAGYVGQASITTLGTITTGIWNAGHVTTAQVNAGNLQLSGNTIISTDVNGNINLTPNGLGSVFFLTGGAVALTTTAQLIGLTQIGVGNLELIANSIEAINAGGSINLLPNGAGVVNISATAAASSELRFFEETGSGNNFIGLKAPNALAGDTTYVMPIAFPAVNGYILSSTNAGVMSWIAATGGTVTSVSGTLNRITSTGGNTPVIDIDANYVGQASITTLGTIGTGTWAGTAVAEIHGGTNQTTYILGDTLYASAANTLAKLPGNTTAAIQYLAQTGTGVVSAAPAWTTISGGDIAGAALTKTDDTNVTMTLGGTPATALLRAASMTLGWTGQLSLARGGSNANLTASNGGIVWSNATQMQILAGTATAGQLLLSGSTATPSWSTSTYPATNAINTLLYASAANVMAALPTANQAVLTTGATGIPVLTALAVNGQLIIGSTAGVPAAATITPGAGISVTNGANSITIAATATALNVNTLNGYRLTLTTNVPVTTSDVTAATTIYATPYKGYDISLYTGVAWQNFQPGQLSITNAGLAVNTVYDVCIDYNAGTPQLTLTAWASNVARATALTYQNGVLVLTGTTTSRYLGSVLTDAATHFNDAASLRTTWNYYNRVNKYLFSSSNASWTYQSAVIRQCNASTSFQVNFLFGVAEDSIYMSGNLQINQTSGSIYSMGFGLDTTTAFNQNATYNQMITVGGNEWSSISTSFILNPIIGYHYLSLNEQSTAGVLTTVGAAALALTITGQILC